MTRKFYVGIVFLGFSMLLMISAFLFLRWGMFIGALGLAATVMTVHFGERRDTMVQYTDVLVCERDCSYVGIDYDGYIAYSCERSFVRFAPNEIENVDIKIDTIAEDPGASNSELFTAIAGGIGHAFARFGLVLTGNPELDSGREKISTISLDITTTNPDFRYVSIHLLSGCGISWDEESKAVRNAVRTAGRWQRMLIGQA